MIPSDHFVRFYNEVFKFLDGENALKPYYDEISRHQELHCLEVFNRNGLNGMYDYWEHIRIEENCDMELTLRDHMLELYMRRCPSLSKVIDNDAGPCKKYCLHCPGWVFPLLAKCGYYAVDDLVSLTEPQCREFIFDNRADAEAKYEELLSSGRDPEAIVNNFDYFDGKKQTSPAGA